MALIEGKFTHLFLVGITWLSRQHVDCLSLRKLTYKKTSNKHHKNLQIPFLWCFPASGMESTVLLNLRLPKCIFKCNENTLCKVIVM